MSLDEQVLEVSRAMATAARQGDLARVQRLVQERQPLLDQWLQQQPAAPGVQRLLALDAEVSSALKQGIADLRIQAAALHQSARALAGYGGGGRVAHSRWLDHRA
jgi:hypothetical protein